MWPTDGTLKDATPQVIVFKNLIKKSLKFSVCVSVWVTLYHESN